ncbi:fimbria/pilus outer membrane usher protein, partial [Shigella sp. FC1967]|uniref:fimbria/pilus outer membrane usher protein n=1 Tax=Shigella sp. FC1967 TaxID=1898041 RepID=UPI000A3F5B94
DYSTWNSSNGKNQWNHINTYLQRNTVSLKSQLQIGDSYTSSALFDSINLDYSTWNSSNGKNQWNHINTYLQRNTVSLKSQL